MGRGPVIGGLKLGEVLLIYILVLVFLIFGMILKGGFPTISDVGSALGCICFLNFLSLNIAFMVTAKKVSFSVKPMVFYYTLMSNCYVASCGIPYTITVVLYVLVNLYFNVFGN